MRARVKDLHSPGADAAGQLIWLSGTHDCLVLFNTTACVCLHSGSKVGKAAVSRGVVSREHIAKTEKFYDK